MQISSGYRREIEIERERESKGEKGERYRGDGERRKIWQRGTQIDWDCGEFYYKEIKFIFYKANKIITLSLQLSLSLPLSLSLSFSLSPTIVCLQEMRAISVLFIKIIPMK